MKPINFFTISRVTTAAAVGYATAILIVFWPFFFSGKSFLPLDSFLMAYKPFAASFPQFSPFNHFDDDVLKFYYPYEVAARAHLYRPYWVPEIFGGIAMYANTYASHFSSLNWLLITGPLAFTYPLKLLVSLWIAGLSMFLLARRAGASGLPAFLGGLGYMFSSLFISLLLRWWLHSALAWFPLVLLFAEKSLENKHRRNIVFAAIFLALAFFDGFFQTSAALVLALGIFMAVSGFVRGGSRGLAHATAVGAVILCTGLLLSAVMWLPQIEYFLADIAKGGSRVGGIYYGKNLMERLLSIPLLIAAFFPQEIGSVRTMDAAKFARSHLQDFSLYVGTIPLLLALSGWRNWKRFPVRAGAWALVVAGLAVPIFTMLDRYFYFRFFAVYICGITLLAAVGLQDLLENPERASFRKLSQAAAWLTGLIFAQGAAVRILLWLKPGWLEAKAHSFIEARLDQSTLGSRSPQWMYDRATAAIQHWSLGSWEFNFPLLVTALAVTVCLLWARKKISDRSFQIIAIGVTFLQLGLFARSWHGFHDPSKFPLFPENEISDFMRTNDPQNIFRASVDDANGIGKEKQLIPSNVNYIYGYSTIEGFDGLRPAVVYDMPAKISDYAALGELNVKYLLTNPVPILFSPDLLLRHKGSVAIYENRAAKSRGRIFFDFEVLPAALAKERVAKGIGPGKAFAWVEKAPEFTPEKNKDPEEAEFLGADFEKSAYRLKNQKAGLFVASESYYPGWTAEFNGKPVEILRANYTMRGISVPGGGGDLVFRFSPSSYFYGLWITSTTFLLALLWLALDAFRVRHVRISAAAK